MMLFRVANPPLRRELEPIVRDIMKQRLAAEQAEDAQKPADQRRDYRKLQQELYHAVLGEHGVRVSQDGWVADASEGASEGNADNNGAAESGDGGSPEDARLAAQRGRYIFENDSAAQEIDLPQQRPGDDFPVLQQSLRNIVATSAISHGVDVDKFNAMFFAGMPGAARDFMEFAVAERGMMFSGERSADDRGSVLKPARVGIDIGGSKMLLLADGHGQRFERQVATGVDSTSEVIAGQIAAFRASLPVQPATIGIAVPGLVREGRIEDCDVVPGLVGWSPGRETGQGAAITVLNDAEAALVEEASELRADATAAIVVVGTGVGAAFQIDGRICRGVSGWAGELGYSPLVSAGAVRTLDQLASGAAILQALGMEPGAIQAAAGAGDERVVAVLANAGTAFGLALATVVNLLNPELISIFGGTLRYPGYVDAALAAARRHSHPKLLANCTIRHAPQVEHLVARGAMRRAQQRS